MIYGIVEHASQTLWTGILFCFLSTTVLGQSATVMGIITDSETENPLIGANVLAIGTAIGTSTDADGKFKIVLVSGSHILRASFIGYEAQEFELFLTEGETYVLNIALVSGANLDPVQVTVGRRNEKALDAPSSIDIVTSQDLQLDVTPTTARSLRNITGLDIVQTGVDRYEIALRGFNNVFSRSTHILTDYRKAGAASIGVNLHNVMPNLAIDTERIEVVRGPGSALYGPGVDSGVIHYISKDPFNYPGVTLSISRGQRSAMNIQGRFATVVGENFGVKLIGNYAIAEDFGLVECDEILLEAERFSECPDPEDAIQLFVDGPRETGQRKFVLSGSADWRISRQIALSVSGGLSSLDGTLLSSIGTVQADGMIANYAQIRLTSGPFFVQAYINSIDSRDSYIYGGGLIEEASEEYIVQAQFSKKIGVRQQLITGVDLTFEHVDKIGAYLQSSTKFSNRLELTLALRGDINNVITDLQLSPRVAFVLKPTLSSSLRATYNRSLSSPLATDYFLNLVAATLGELRVRARGGESGFTYRREPAYVDQGAPTSLVASSMLPGMEGMPTPVGIDTGIIYELIYEGLSAIPDAELVRLLASAGLNIPVQFLSILKEALNPAMTVVQGFSPGVLGIPNLSTLMIELNPQLNHLQDLTPIQPAITQSWEIGYKGIIQERFLFSIDGYFEKRKNFLGPLQIKTPFVLVPNLEQDLIRDISDGLEANVDIANVLRFFGLMPEQAAELLVNLAGRDLPDRDTPIAIVQPNENNPGVGVFPELMLTYPNFGKIQYFGIDISTQVMVNNRLRFFGNVSWISDDYFDSTELNEETEDIELALNAPDFKFKMGGQYQRSNGISISMSGRYTNGFPVIAGQYVGNVDSYMTLDLGIGYSISQVGVRVDLGVSNVFDSNHREFVGAPRLGRVASLRLTYVTDRGP
ncbi:MAG: TonB-dependent receptor [Bacteroidetes bacterium]|nr:TonB-dependent receptor [Bacteroidota bacterium]